jgi:hypothetical protein
MDRLKNMKSLNNQRKGDHLCRYMPIIIKLGASDLFISMF